MNTNIKCAKCRKHPNQLDCYTYFAKEEGISNEDYVIYNEGTYNHKTGAFYCDDCYIAVGMPLGKA